MTACILSFSSPSCVAKVCEGPKPLRCTQTFFLLWGGGKSVVFVRPKEKKWERGGGNCVWGKVL